MDTSVSGRTNLPSVDRILSAEAAKPLLAEHGSRVVTDAIRSVLQRYRDAGGREPGMRVPAEAAILADVSAELVRLTEPSLKPVFNLTGTVVHTNLGRALLPEAAIAALTEAAREPTNLEYDLEKGARGDRDVHVEEWLCRLTGAEAATIVNNNAAAVMLVLNTLAQKKEVPVSRGELIEIGGSFRMPAIMARAGARLKEIGTTNRTHAADYRTAISKKTALILKVHTSNYEVKGFTATVSERELADIAHNAGLPLVVDLGAGALIDFSQYGLPREPTVAETIAHGADLVTFSGDKLLGGPQAGLIAGRADLIAAIKKNPMKRAMRCDKLTIAALGVILRMHTQPERLFKESPLLRQLCRTKAEIHVLASRLAPLLQARLDGIASVSIEDAGSVVGSGARPLDRLDSVALVIEPLGAKKEKSKRLQLLIDRFKNLPRPVLGRTGQGNLIFDLRTLEDERTFIAQLDFLSLTSPSAENASRP